MNIEYDVIVVGGGHAGAEAALAAARSGAQTLLVTIGANDIATMPCNPAIGGIAKSHLVFELDALGGEIARNADYTGIQFRILNTKKGPAVQANRVQCDKFAYSRRMATVVSTTPGLDIIESTVKAVDVRDGKLRGVILGEGRDVSGKTVVITTGTYLNGRIHIGDKVRPGGRGDVHAVDELSQSLKDLGFKTARLKTGTPPRLNSDTIDYSQMDLQPGIDPAPFFSWETENRRSEVGDRGSEVGDMRMFHVEQSDRDDSIVPRGTMDSQAQNSTTQEQIDLSIRPWAPGENQMPCYLTHTTEQTHKIIADNLEKSSLYGGAIEGTGVRYCPSIEDKIVKFSEAKSHHVFIEPEGRETNLIYPNGTSNSLPEAVQEEMIHSIPGLENAEILEWGYAIEYDFVDPTQLTHSLETKQIEGLFMAGQINGTTGYEEAAAQGFVAGINAARKSQGKSSWTLGRGEAYIGVLIDDLVTKGTDEPYRMFTSRAEHRLILRQDNARFRLLKHAEMLGIVSEEHIKESHRYANLVSEEINRLESTFITQLSLSQLLKRPENTYSDLPSANMELPETVIRQVEIEVKYAGYIVREKKRIEKVQQLEHQRISQDIDYWAIKTISYESREKLSRIRPETIAQAARIPGISPADIAILAIASKSAG